MSSISLLPADGGLALVTPYDPAFVSHFKQLIPDHERRWDGQRRQWLLDARHGATVAALVFNHFQVDVTIPDLSPSCAQPELRVIKLEYLGRCKQRSDSCSASGFADGGWTMVFPEAVLKTWFQAVPERKEPDAPQTLYSVLTVLPTATADEIKKAFRRLALHTHPDRNREPDAAEQFQRIKSAYDILGDELKRRKYDVGLKFEHSTQPKREHRAEAMRHRLGYDDGYRAPLRCGLLVIEGTTKLGQFVVSNILKWDDIIRDDGKTMVSSWPVGAQHFEVTWV